MLYVANKPDGGWLQLGYIKKSVGLSLIALELYLAVQESNFELSLVIVADCAVRMM